MNNYSRIKVKITTEFTVAPGTVSEHAICLTGANSKVLSLVSSHSFFQIYGCSIMLVPRMNAIGYSGLKPNDSNILHAVGSNMYILFTPETGNVYDSDAIKNHPRSKLHMFNRVIRHYVRIFPSVRVNTNAINNVDIQLGRKCWVSCSDYAASFGQFYFCHTAKVTDGYTVPVQYDAIYTYYVKLKGLNISNL